MVGTLRAASENIVAKHICGRCTQRPYKHTAHLSALSCRNEVCDPSSASVKHEGNKNSALSALFACKTNALIFTLVDLRS